MAEGASAAHEGRDASAAAAAAAPVGVLENAAARMGSRARGKTEGLLLWRTSLMSAVKSEGWLEANAPGFAKLVFDSLWMYSDRRCQGAVDDVIAVAVKEKAFLKAFAGALAKAPASRLPPSQSLVMLRWTTLVLVHLELPASAKAADVLLKSQVQLLQTLKGSSYRPRVWMPVLGAALRSPLLLEKYLAVVCSKDSKDDVGLTAAVVWHCAGHPTALQEHQAALLQAFCDKVVMAREAVPPATMDAWRPLLGSLSLEQAAGALLPKAELALKRTPDAALSMLGPTLAALKGDLSPLAAPVAAAVTPLLRHARKENRDAAAAVMGSLAGGLSDAEALGGACSSLQDVLAGKVAGGKIKAAQERSGVVAGLEALSGAPGVDPAALAAQGGATSGFLCSVYAEEATEDGMLQVLSALEAWLRCLGSGPSGTLPGDVLKLLTAAVAESNKKEAVRGAALSALLAVLEGEQPWAREAAAPLLPRLSQIAADGAAKAAMRTDGASALLAAVQICATVSDEGASQATWGVVSASSVYFSAATASKLPPKQAARLAKATGRLLSSHADRVEAKPGATDALCGCLAVLGLHFSREVLDAALEGASAAVAASPRLSAPLVEAVRSRMRDPETAPVLLAPTATEDDGVDPCAAARRFRSILVAALPAAPADLGAQLGAEVMLAAHHPRAAVPLPPTARGVNRSAWGRCCLKLPSLKAGASAYGPVLLGDTGLRSSGFGDRAASLAALSSAVLDSEGAFMDEVLPELESALERSEHDALTEAQVAAFNAPEGVLSSELKKDTDRIPDINIDANSGGRIKGKPSEAEEDFSMAAPSLKRPASAASAASAAGGGRGAPGKAGGRGGRGGAGKKDPAQELRDRKLAEEAETRAQLTAMKGHLADGLNAVAAVVGANSQHTLARLEAMTDLVVPFLGSPLVGDNAAPLSAATRLATCLPGTLGRQSTSLAAALRIIKASEQRRSSSSGALSGPLDSHPAVQSTVAALVAITEGSRGKPLPSSAYNLCFPVLRGVLAQPHHTDLHDGALAVVSLHVAPGMVLPRAQTLEVLYHVLGVVPAYRDRVQPLLRSLCSGLETEDMAVALRGLLAGSASVRAAALDALPLAPALREGQGPEAVEDLAVLWLARHDPDEANAAGAAQLWESCGARLPGSGVSELLIRHLSGLFPDIRGAAAKALSRLLEEQPGAGEETLSLLIGTYSSAPQEEVRQGVALALGQCAPLLHGAEVSKAMDFLLGSGLADDSPAVREAMVKAGSSLVDAHGAERAQGMLPLFEGYLDRSKARRSSLDLSEDDYDRVREGAVVFLGTLARHLPKEDPKVRSVLDMLIDALTIPSESVQRAVSACLIPLMPCVSADKEYVDTQIKRLLEMLTKAEKYGDRRGAAFGIAGAVKGLGISSLKAYGVMDTLKVAVENKKEALAREGALFAFEALSERLGRLFEPYVISILPMLLVCFGDSQPAVREATEGASKAIMGQLSGQGVKLVLPSLLRGLEEEKWRTKQGSIQLLGAMAYCAPKQLSTCLPTIVPRLSDVLADPHPKVQTSSQQALNEIGSVIRNPEVQRLVPSLLNALAQPNIHTKACLDVVLKTVFVNTIDSPSLSLILPVVHRGLRDRTGDIKKKAARIVGNMCQLINDPKDMEPYVPLLMPELKKALVDPLPEVRATAAKAMGSLLHGMGEAQFSDLIPWLLKMLKSEESGVERGGAAQGLSEVLAVLGKEHLEAILPEIIDGTSSRHSYTREGHQTLFRFLPIRMEAAFQGSLEKVLPCILNGLADQEEGVRNAALAAGHKVVEVYAASDLPMLLPVVEAGIFNENWRIRHSSVELLGDLLFEVAGASGKVVLEGDSDDEGISTESHGAAIVEALGMDRRNEVLARVYMARSDVSFTVRSSAVHVWKTIVVNTPRTLGDIMTSLMEQVIESLADEGEERRQMAGRCIGELVRKMGERVLSSVVPILTDGVDEGSKDLASRRGVCYGLKEVLENITKAQLQEHLEQILPALQSALCDSDAAVRDAAGEAFGILFRGGGGGMIDTVVPGLLASLDNASSVDKSIEGLRVILSVRPQTFGHVLPKLMAKPRTAARITAVGELGSVASASLPAHIDTLLPQLLVIGSGTSGGSEAVAEAARGAALALSLAVPEEAVYMVVNVLTKALDGGLGPIGAAILIGKWVPETKVDLQEHTAALLTATLSNLADEDPELVRLCWEGAKAVSATVPKELAPTYTRVVKEAVGTSRERQRRKRNGDKRVAGLCLPKALTPVLPFFLQGVLQGSSSELREMAAEGLGELVEATDEATLKPFTVQITGPLIRLIGDRFSWQIKAAILTTMGLLIDKAGVGMKPFVPQMQTTFLKCLNDPAKKVRECAAVDLGALSKMSARIDQLATDVSQSIASASDPQICFSFVDALFQLLKRSADRLSPATAAAIGERLESLQSPTPINYEERGMLAEAIGAWAPAAAEEDLKRVLSAALQASVGQGAAGAEANDRHMGARTLQALCGSAFAQVSAIDAVPKVVTAINKCVTHPDVSIKLAAGRAAGRLLAAEAEANGGSSAAPSLEKLQSAFIGLLGPDQRSETQRSALAALRAAARHGPAVLEPGLPELVPLVCSLVTSVQGPLKLTAERSLATVLQLQTDTDVADTLIESGQLKGMAKTLLNAIYLNRIAKLGPVNEEDEDEEDRYP